MHLFDTQSGGLILHFAKKNKIHALIGILDINYAMFE
jgi:hypothetical protein